MKTGKDLILEHMPTLRSAVEAMIEGLSDPAKHGLTVDMGHFGTVERGVCFGCAATATLLASGVFDATDYVDGGIYLPVRPFENAIDFFRMGDPEPLCRYYGVNCPGLTRFNLQTNNYKEQLPLVREWLNRHFPKEQP